MMAIVTSRTPLYSDEDDSGFDGTRQEKRENESLETHGSIMIQTTTTSPPQKDRPSAWLFSLPRSDDSFVSLGTMHAGPRYFD